MASVPVSVEQERYVYRFGGGVSDGGNGDRNLLGGKGANLDGMAGIGLPVPPGFTISTPMCTRYYEEGGAFPDSLRDEVAEGLAHIEKVTGKPYEVVLKERVLDRAGREEREDVDDAPHGSAGE